MSTATNPDELAKYIEYRLDMLSEENAHHRFEELSFRIARATVASDLLPPTGPVSAGGDQGRDFESYRIDGAGGNVTRMFAQLAPQDTKVFACTTQQGSNADIAGKVRHDVKTACEREPKPTVIYFYASSVTLPPAARHNLQDWAREQHALHLEFIGRREISEILADPPNQWLAQHYLAVPEEMLQQAPDNPPHPPWYEDAKRRMKNPEDRYVATHAELDLIVRCARHAWGTDGLEVDDGLWLDLLADVWGAPDGLATRTGLRAFYEAFVYLLRGRDRCGLEAHMPEYVAGLATIDDLGLSRDAQCFASYLAGGVARGHIALGHSAASDLFKRVVAWIEAKIDSAPGPSALADLLVKRGALVPAYALLGEAPADQDELASLATETLGWWTRALDAGERLISFPLLHLSELLAGNAAILADSPDYESFVLRLDQACENRHTSEGLAATMRDRAISLFNAERYLDAVSPMLAAKRHWHNGDRIRGSLMASMLAGECFGRLGLLWAAKHCMYDVVAVCDRIGDKQQGDILTDAVFQLAEHHYLSGEWANAIYIYRCGLVLHLEYAADPWNFEKHKRLNHTDFYLLNMLVAGDMVAPGFQEWGESLLQSWDLADLFDRFADTVRENWKSAGLVEGVLNADCPLHGPPLADLAATRRARWQALGLTWEVCWPTDYELEAFGSELAAVLQFVQAGLAAKRYRHFLPTQVVVKIDSSHDDQIAIQAMPFKNCVAFQVMCPSEDCLEDQGQDVRAVALAAATTVLEAVSVDPDFADRLPDSVGNAISDGLLVGADISEGRRILVPPDAWSELMSAPAPTGSELRLENAPSTGLPWLRGLSPLFDQPSAEEKLRNRYQNGFNSAKPVLDAHGKQPELQRLVAKLRSEGWLDWQIASAFAPAAVSYNANSSVPRDSIADVGQAMEDGLRKAMRGVYSVPPWTESFAELIPLSLQGSLISALRVWGLDANYVNPDIDGLRRFLGERFQHFSHDLPEAQRPKFPWEHN